MWFDEKEGDGLIERELSVKDDNNKKYKELIGSKFYSHLFTSCYQNENHFFNQI